jgi:rhodanese-related sulfurtransferase
MDYNRYLEFALNHYLLSLALLVVSFLLIQDLLETAFKKFASISPLLAVAKMNNEPVVVVDVREPLEFTESHITDALNKPLSKLTEELPSLEAYKKTPLLLACQTGTRSATAAKLLGKAGFENVFVITGGMAAWENDYKLPVKISKNKKS